MKPERRVSRTVSTSAEAAASTGGGASGAGGATTSVEALSGSSSRPAAMNHAANSSRPREERPVFWKASDAIVAACVLGGSSEGHRNAIGVRLAGQQRPSEGAIRARSATRAVRQLALPARWTWGACTAPWTST